MVCSYIALASCYRNTFCCCRTTYRFSKAVMSVAEGVREVIGSYGISGRGARDNG